MPRHLATLTHVTLIRRNCITTFVSLSAANSHVSFISDTDGEGIANFSEDSGLEKRVSSGLAESIESNPELDALSRMVVDKVLERISKSGAGGPIQPQATQVNTQPTSSKVVCDDKSSLAVTQMRHLLQRERNLVSELQVRAILQYIIVLYFDTFYCTTTLQAAINTERLKALEWMERHNREKESMRELQAT